MYDIHYRLVSEDGIQRCQIYCVTREKLCETLTFLFHDTKGMVFLEKIYETGELF